MSKRTWLLIGLFFLGFVAVRSVHFVDSLNFSYDQGFFSLNALRLWQTKKIVLIGPTASLGFAGRMVFQGSVIYYMLLVFLLIGNFQPVAASSAFMVFAGVMIVPLFLGVKNLAKKVTVADGNSARDPSEILPAILVTTFYCFFPFYVTYTRFLWNPNFQFALLPILIFGLGKWHILHSRTWFVFVAAWAGLLLQFHFQFALVILGLLIYFFVVKKIAWQNIFLFATGWLIGVFPLALFEVRHQFYNTQTVWLFLTHFGEFAHNAVGSGSTPHYYLSLSFLVLIATVLAAHYFWAQLFTKHTVGAACFFIVALCLWKFVPPPAHAFGMVPHWTITDDETLYKEIRSAGVKDYNIANLAYDTLAVNQKFFHARDGVEDQTHFADYYTNLYLFVVSADDQYLKNSAYEVNTFIPSTLIRTWPINDTFTLYLLKRN